MSRRSSGWAQAQPLPLLHKGGPETAPQAQELLLPVLARASVQALHRHLCMQPVAHHGHSPFQTPSQEVRVMWWQPATPCRVARLLLQAPHSSDLFPARLLQMAAGLSLSMPRLLPITPAETHHTAMPRHLQLIRLWLAPRCNTRPNHLQISQKQAQAPPLPSCQDRRAACSLLAGRLRTPLTRWACRLRLREQLRSASPPAQANNARQWQAWVLLQRLRRP